MLALFATLALSTPAVSGPVSPAPLAAPAQFFLSLNRTKYNAGDPVRVKFESTDDGYLIVFRVDGDGYVRVLFPLDPDLDPFIRGHKQYELRGRGEREAFRADNRSGNGMVYAALSREPLDLRAYADGNHWDYSRVRLSAWDADAEVELTKIVKAMSSNGDFTYDVKGYRVEGEVAYVSGGGGIAPVPSTYGYQDSYYDPYGSCLGCNYGYRGGTSIYLGISTRWSSYDRWGSYDRWDPWYYDNFPYRYSPYGYGYNTGYYGGYNDWRYPGQYRPITVINLPRPQVPTNTAYGLRARPRTAIPGLAANLSGGGRPEERPTTARVPNDGRARGRTEEPVRQTPAADTRRTERVSQPSTPPTAGRPVTSSTPPSSAGSSGESRARTRRPDEIATPVKPVPDLRPSMDRGQPIRQTEVVRPNVERPEQVVRPMTESGPESARPVRQSEPQPVFREPFRARPADAERAKPRVERSAPGTAAPERSQPVYRQPPQSSRAEPPRRMDPPSPPRQSEPVTRSAPPPSSPPSSAGSSTGSSSTGRARRPDN